MRAREALENLDRFHARVELGREIGDRRFDQAVDELPKRRWISVGEQPGRSEVGSAATGDHIARDRPGGAAKAEHRAGIRQFPLHLRDRLEDRAEPSKVDPIGQSPETRGFEDRIEPRPLSLDEAHLAVQCIGHHEDIREQDRGVDAEPPHGLQRHFRGHSRCVGEIEHAFDCGPHGPIFGKEASRLAHEPDRRRIDARAFENGEQRFR